MKMIGLSGLAMLASQAAFAQIRYNDVEPIIDSYCVVCHVDGGGAGFLPLDSFDGIVGNQERMYNAIIEGRMPFGNPDFAETEDGATLLSWLKDGVEWQEPPPNDGPPPLINRDPRTLRFEDVEQILKANCQGCHAPGGRMARKPFTTLRQVRREAKDAWEELDDGNMPPNNPDFAFSIEGRVLSGWLRYGEDVRWRDWDDDDDHHDDD